MRKGITVHSACSEHFEENLFFLFKEGLAWFLVVLAVTLETLKILDMIIFPKRPESVNTILLRIQYLCNSKLFPHSNKRQESAKYK